MQNRLDRKFSKIRKEKMHLPHGGVVAELRKSFFSQFPDFPKDLLYDLFQYFVSAYSGGDDVYKDFDILSGKLTDLAELLGGEYDELSGSITDSDLDFIKDSIADFAYDLNDDIVFAVMQKAVERGRFHT